MTVIDGTWYIKITGDYAGRISGGVYDVSNETNPVPISLEVCASDDSNVNMSNLTFDTNIGLIFRPALIRTPYLFNSIS